MDVRRWHFELSRRGPKKTSCKKKVQQGSHLRRNHQTPEYWSPALPAIEFGWKVPGLSAPSKCGPQLLPQFLELQPLIVALAAQLAGCPAASAVFFEARLLSGALGPSHPFAKQHTGIKGVNVAARIRGESIVPLVPSMWRFRHHGIPLVDGPALLAVSAQCASNLNQPDMQNHAFIQLPGKQRNICSNKKASILQRSSRPA